MVSAPLFSCVIPVKGNRPFFGEAISSLKSQGYEKDLEIIIQDADVEPDVGQSDALNKGFAKTKGEWLFWLNADDVLLPGAIKRVLDRIDGSDRIDWIAGDTVYLDEKGIVKEVRTDAKWRPWFGKKLSVWTGGPSAFFRRSLWEKRGGFDADLKYVMDIDLWTRWAKAGERFVGLGDYIWGFREHEASLTGSGDNRAAQLGEWARIDARCGVASTGFWRNLTRVACVLDGSWFKRQRDTAKLKGRHWREIV